MKKTILLLVWLGVHVSGQGIWLTSGRTHPELCWSTVSSEHFNIHYHQGLEAIAEKALSIAEQSRPVLMEQMGLTDLPKIDITLTAEDEVMNGYAMWSNTIFIWVDQNDAALWLEDQKWLYQVMTHELQHVVFFNALASPWLPEPWNYTVSGTPGWFVEGLAEYMTEHWRPYRADLSHKLHILRNNVQEMNPHHDGYSKLLYLADRFNDSTIVNIIQYRTKLKTANFKKGFKKYTGISVEQFNEDWRRQMNTYYYGYRAQKETIEEVGQVVSLPMKEQYGFAVSPDSMRIAIVSRMDKDHLDQSLVIATRDTTKKKPGILKKALEKVKKKKEEKAQKQPLVWKTEEVDYGRIQATLSWSPDGKKLAYAKYHYGARQSLVWDLRVADFSGKKPHFRWITDTGRALHPDWSPDGKRLVYVLHSRNVSNLITVDLATDAQDTLTHFTEDTQILTPRWSPDGKRIAMAVSGADGNLDIAVLTVASGDIQRVTHNPKAEYRPVWHPDGTKITYTSHAGNDSLDSAPNLFTVNLSTGNTLQNTDVGDAVWSTQWTPGDSTVLAATLADLDTVRLVKVNPSRRATTGPLAIRPAFSRWQNHHPPDTLSAFDPRLSVDTMTRERYRFYRHPRHLASLVFPYFDGHGFFGTTSWMDAMGRHILQAAGGLVWTGPGKPWLLVSYLNGASWMPWGINYFSNSRWDFRYYDQSASGLNEQLDGLDLYAQVPLNLGQSLSNNHSLNINLGLYNRRADAIYDSVDSETGIIFPRDPADFRDLPVPESGREGILSIYYQWINRRPNRKNIILPTQGGGLILRSDFADQSLFGDFTFSRWEADGFINLPTGGGMALFARLKGQAMSGKPAVQDSLGLTRDPNIYLPTGLLNAGIFFVPETNNPRGWDHVRLGDRLVFGTVEYRIPLIPQLPIEIMGLTLGSLTGAAIMDFGNAWISGKPQPEWVVTTGYEVKIGIQAGKTPLIFVAVGQAQPPADWDAGISPKTYARLALINPF